MSMIYIKRALRELSALFGVESNSTSHGEKWISSIGALLGILTVYWASQWYLDTAGIMLMVASMGASAVLLFAVPHGALSQPWPVLGGNLISAFVGVTCQQLYPDHPLTPALAVGLAVACMHYFRCMHPPGGATALSAVIGGPEIAAMGYSYLITPILVNVLSILTIAILFNALFPWRRYPAHWVRRRQAAPATPQPSVPVALTQEDFTAAMQKLDSYIDITAEDLVELVELASEHARQASSHPERIEVGKYYSNGQAGSRRIIRQVTKLRKVPGRTQMLVSYRTLEGSGSSDVRVCPWEEFQLWARDEVIDDQGEWVRIPSPKRDSDPELPAAMAEAS